MQSCCRSDILVLLFSQKEVDYEKIIVMLLVVMLCMSLLACEKDEQNNDFLGQPGGSQDQPDGGNTEKEPQASEEFYELVCGVWDCVGGWNELGSLEIRADGTFLCKGQELSWDATIKSKQWFEGTKEFLNVYKNGELVYDAHVVTSADGQIELVIGEADGSELDEMGLMPAGTYVKQGKENQ